MIALCLQRKFRGRKLFQTHPPSFLLPTHGCPAHRSVWRPPCPSPAPPACVTHRYAPSPLAIKLLHFRLSFGVLSLEDLRTTIRCDPVKWHRDTPHMRYARSHTHSWREAAHGGPRSPSPTKPAPVTTHEWFKIGPGGSVYMTEINKLHKSRWCCSPRAQVVPCRLAHYLPQSCNI